jgi:protein ImuB
VGSRRLITAADVVALSLGLHVGMPVSKAPALMPELQVLLADPAADAASFERLALWVLQRVSPVVAVNGPNGLVSNSTGTRTSPSAPVAQHRHYVPIALTA